MQTETAIFAAGCFWKPEYIFSKVSGVLKTRTGYTGGKKKNPNYSMVYGGNTGHVEAVEITYNPKIVSYKDLLDVFWESHNPTEKDRQGVDIGARYNSMIFYTNEKQREIAEKSKKEKQIEFGGKIATQIKKARVFYPAEEYHQKYFEKQEMKSNNSFFSGR